MHKERGHSTLLQSIGSKTEEHQSSKHGSICSNVVVIGIACFGAALHSKIMRHITHKNNYYGLNIEVRDVIHPQTHTSTQFKTYHCRPKY